MLNRDRKRGEVLESGKKTLGLSKDAPGGCWAWRHL